MSEVRTRFAPSPTGFLHIGGIRTALFAYLVAKQSNGQFVLRLEDTDQKREVIGADQHIMDSLHALGIDYDEGPDIGGPFGPYRQTERKDSYKKWAQKLVDAGRAYADPYTPEEVQMYRQAAQKAKQPFLYRNYRPENPPKWDGSQPLRFKSEPKAYRWHDEVMGDLSTGPEVVDDFILIKSDGLPTYNFAHVVDDAEMQISHIIRGQEFIASVPNYLNLYEALELKPPVMAIMPHIMGTDGKKKLSKRDGAKDVLDYIKDGYLPDALVSFIATLGWNDGTEQEIFSRQELIKKFSLNRVQRSGAHFDNKRLDWVNSHFIRQLSLDKLAKLANDFWPPEAKKSSDDYKQQILGLLQERLKYLAEIPGLTGYFFTEPKIDPSLISSHKQLKKLEKAELKQLLETSLGVIKDSDFSQTDLQAKLNDLLEKTGQKPAVLFSLIRIATTQAPASPGLPETMAVLGKESSIKRIQAQIDAL